MSASRDSASLSRSSVVSNVFVGMYFGATVWWRPSHSSTSAPFSNATLASSTPVSPVVLFVTTRTSSIGSAVEPVITTTRCPASSRVPIRRITRATISSVSASFAFSSSNFGVTNSTPSFSRVRM